MFRDVALVGGAVYLRALNLDWKVKLDNFRTRTPKPFFFPRDHMVTEVEIIDRNHFWPYIFSGKNGVISLTSMVQALRK